VSDSPVPGALAAAKLRAVRMALLALHSSLLAYERARYERRHGRVDSPGQMLNLVMNDPWFAWLRPISALVVQADERLDSDEGVTAADVAAFAGQVQSLLQGALAGTDPVAYQRALQEAPEVGLARGRLAAALTQP
jgi:hypothetical protein